MAEDGNRDPLARAFGERVRSLRRRAGLSLEQLAERSRVSRAMLSKVERGEKSPTLGLAMRISHAVGGSMAALLTGEQPRSATAVRREAERDIVAEPGGTVTREILSPTLAGSAVEILRHRLAVGGSTGPLPPYPPGTEKYAIVEAGSIVLLRGGAALTAEQGDVVFFEADVEHEFRNRGGVEAAYILVTSRCLLAMDDRRASA